MYNANQQRMRYLVEFSLPDEDTLTEGNEKAREEAITEDETEDKACSDEEDIIDSDHGIIWFLLDGCMHVHVYLM